LSVAFPHCRDMHPRAQIQFTFEISWGYNLIAARAKRVQLLLSAPPHKPRPPDSYPTPTSPHLIRRPDLASQPNRLIARWGRINDGHNLSAECPRTNAPAPARPGLRHARGANDARNPPLQSLPGMSISLMEGSVICGWHGMHLVLGGSCISVHGTPFRMVCARS
jgi:hypothetical protein